MVYETVIGLEIHAELKTKTKIFCSCSTEFGKKPNENTCPICLGIPGTLPVLNEDVIKLAVKAGTALGCKINNYNKMDRKNYFYPDLTKNFQTSQYDIPMCGKGLKVPHWVKFYVTIILPIIVIFVFINGII